MKSYLVGRFIKLKLDFFVNELKSSFSWKLFSDDIDDKQVWVTLKNIVKLQAAEFYYTLLESRTRS